jgi:hypothetical protein
MKIRNGFISNSSSSSFIVIGKRLSDVELKNEYEKLIKKKSLFACSYSNDKTGSTADYFIVNKKMIEKYLKHGQKKEISFLRSDICISNCQSFNPMDLPNEYDDFDIINIIASDDYQTTTYKQFAATYLCIDMKIPENIQSMYERRMLAEKEIENLQKEIYEIDEDMENENYYIMDCHTEDERIVKID